MTQLSTQPRTIQLSDVSSLKLDHDRRPKWLRAIADEALSRFSELGLPTMRDEEWRFTRIKPIAESAFRSPEQPEENLVSPTQIEQFSIKGMTCSRLVFVNGYYMPGLSELRDLSKDVHVLPLSEAISSHSDLVAAHLARHAPYRDDAFTALNTASIAEGAFVHVPEGITVEHPIHVLNITASGDEPVIVHPRNLIVTGAKTRATIVEDYVALHGNEDVYFNNAVTEIIVGAEAKITHYLMERESTKAFNIQTLRIHQEEKSDFASHSLMTGGAIVRNNVNPHLAGENCHSLLNGLYLTRDKQHVDNHMRVEHAKPNCDSRQYYKGILNDKSTAVFSGRIIVDQVAQKTDAVQSNANLLLSDDARVNTHPQLEIYADDVKCTHGATIGELDEQAIFYLQTRGVNESVARGFLIYAFANESLERIDLEPIRKHMENVLFDRLPHGEDLRRIA
jgi:Fe-S cluster assembly protein SufD